MGLSGAKETLYDFLDVSRDASAEEIARAYGRVKAEIDREAAGGDQRRTVLLHEAHEVFSSPARRAAYDASLKTAPRFKMPESTALGFKGKLVIAAVALLLAGSALYAWMRPATELARIPQEILAATSPSVGLMQNIDIAGKRTPVATAFAVDRSVMVTTCLGIDPNTQAVVVMGPRSLVAQVSIADQVLDVCKLTVAGAGSWPLAVSSAAARAGDKIYAATATQTGEVTIRQGEVKRVIAAPNGGVLELTIAPGAGAPVLDVKGRVVGIGAAKHAHGVGLHIALPAQWIHDARTRRPGGEPSPPPAEPKARPTRKAPINK